jgi:hypothetical protein
MHRITTALIILVLGLTYGVQDKGVTQVINPKLTGVDFTIPHSINFQGYLYQAGNPVTDTMDMWFGIYGAPSGGSLLYQITVSNVEVIQGYFNAILTNIPNAVFPVEGPIRYLEIKAPANEPALSPRTPLLSVGYSYHALTADTAEYAKAAPISRPITPLLSGSEIAKPCTLVAAVGGNQGVLYVSNPGIGPGIMVKSRSREGVKVDSANGYGFWAEHVTDGGFCSLLGDYGVYVGGTTSGGDFYAQTDGAVGIYVMADEADPNDTAIQADGKGLATGGWHTGGLKGNKEAPCIISPERTIIAYGNATLKDGDVELAYPQIFTENIRTDLPIYISLTPRGEPPGMLYVKETKSDGFRVALKRIPGWDEKSYVAFDWVAFGILQEPEISPEAKQKWNRMLQIKNGGRM